MKQKVWRRRFKVKLGLLAIGMVAPLWVATPSVATTPTTGACLDEIEIEVPNEDGVTFGQVTLAKGETFVASVRSRTSHPDAATHLDGFVASVRLSPIRTDGFPNYASTSQTRSYVADQPLWGDDGWTPAEAFSYTNPSNSQTTEFLFEVGYWGASSGQIEYHVEASGFSSCVSAVEPPARPTPNCDAWPTYSVASRSSVSSDSFMMEPNATLFLRAVAERDVPRDQNDNVVPGLISQAFSVRVYLYGRSGPGDSWHYIRRGSFASESRWSRGAYVTQGQYLRNSSNYEEVKVVIGPWIGRDDATVSVVSSSMRESGGSWESFCSSDTQVCTDTVPLAEPVLAGTQISGRTFMSAWSSVPCAEAYHWRVFGPGFDRYGASEGATSMFLELPANVADGEFCLSVLAVNGGKRPDSARVNADGAIPEGCADFVDAYNCNSGVSLYEPTLVGAAFVGRELSVAWSPVPCAEAYHWRVFGSGFDRYGASEGATSMSLELPANVADGEFCLSVLAVNGGKRPDSARVNADGAIPEGCATMQLTTNPAPDSGITPIGQTISECPITMNLRHTDVYWNSIQVELFNGNLSPFPTRENNEFRFERRLPNGSWERMDTVSEGSQGTWRKMVAKDLRAWKTERFRIVYATSDEPLDSGMVCAEYEMTAPHGVQPVSGQPVCPRWEQGGGDDRTCVTYFDRYETDEFLMAQDLSDRQATIWRQGTALEIACTAIGLRVSVFSLVCLGDSLIGANDRMDEDNVLATLRSEPERYCLIERVHRPWHGGGQELKVSDRTAGTLALEDEIEAWRRFNPICDADEGPSGFPLSMTDWLRRTHCPRFPGDLVRDRDDRLIVECPAIGDPPDIEFPL